MSCVCALATMEIPSIEEENGTNFAEKEGKELLYRRVEDLKCSIAALQAENDMFERFISRLDPHELVSQAGGGEGPGPAGASQQESGGLGWRRRSRPSISDRLPQLSFEQKLYVAQREVAETQQDHENLKQRYERIQDNYMASLNESEVRLAEIGKAKKEFERRVLDPTKDNKLETKEPEMVLQYIIDKFKVTQVEKLNLKNQALKVQEKKLQQQLQRQKEMGKADYEAIFPEYSEQRTDKNLDELQVSSLKVQRVLTSHKDKLKSVTSESADLSSDLTNRKQMLAKIEEEIRQAEEERLKAEALNRHLHRQMTDYQAPDVTEYMHVKDRHRKLQQRIHTWERKVGIAEMTLKSGKQRVALTPTNSAAAPSRSGNKHVPVKLPYITDHSTRSGEAESQSGL